MSHSDKILSLLFCLFVVSQLSTASAQKHVGLSRTHWKAILELNTEKLASLQLDSELLAASYEELFVDHIDPPEPTWYVAIKEDLMRRGDSGTPILLGLIDRSYEGYLEGLFFSIEDYSNITLEPFLEAAREHWRRNKQSSKPRSCYAISRLLSRRGNAEDVNLLKEMKAHPSKEVGFVVQPDIERMEKRISGTLKPTEWTGSPPAGYLWPEKSPPKKSPSAVPAPSTKEEPLSSTPWSIIVVVIVAATGLAWLVLKNRK